jgi:hypothetical protein
VLFTGSRLCYPKESDHVIKKEVSPTRSARMQGLFLATTVRISNPTDFPQFVPSLMLQAVEMFMYFSGFPE